jgi:sigma-B regulation protein RsbU (phosphoserine phosphatase)
MGAVFGAFALAALFWAIRRPGDRRAEEKRRREQHDELLKRHQDEVNAAIGKKLGREEMLNCIARAAIGCTGALGACVFEETAQGSFQGTAVNGLFPPQRKLPKHLREKPSRRSRLIEHIMRSERLLMGEGVIGEVAANRRGELVADGSRDPRIPSQEEPAARVRTMIAVPILTEDRVDGVLAVANSVGGTPFTNEDFAAARWMADKAAEVVRRT